MSYLILVRHGQSVWNLEKKFTGWVDVDLTENGKSEAKKAGQLINQENIEINLYYSSFQLRAKNTLKIIQEELKDFKTSSFDESLGKTGLTAIKSSGSSKEKSLRNINPNQTTSLILFYQGSQAVHRA